MHADLAEPRLFHYHNGHRARLCPPGIRPTRTPFPQFPRRAVATPIPENAIASPALRSGEAPGRSRAPAFRRVEPAAMLSLSSDARNRRLMPRCRPA